MDMSDDGFGAAEDQEELPPDEEYMGVTLYFFAEEGGLRHRTFPPQWYDW